MNKTRLTIRVSSRALLVLALAVGCGDEVVPIADTGAPLVDQAAEAALPDLTAPDSGADALADQLADTAPGDAAAADAQALDALLMDAKGSDAKKYTKLKDICFKNVANNPLKPGPDYDQFLAKYGTHCHGTNHQDVKKIQKVVFLGDSITAGTPPTMFWDYYRNRLVALLEKKFGKLEVKNCSKYGARVDDLLKPPHKQILTCLPTLPEKKTTLVVMTIGGNDGHAWAKAAGEGKSMTEIMKKVDAAIKDMNDAIKWFRKPGRFPNGVHVIFSNIYEYTDGTGDLLSCPLAIFAGLKGKWPQGRKAYLKFNEQFMKIAVDTKSDMVFMLENFCGHGFKASDPKNECYLGPKTATWFDLTCIHPNPKGHEMIAKMFMNVVNQ